MKKQRPSLKKYGILPAFGLWAVFCVIAAGIGVQAAGEAETSELTETETLTELPVDGIYAMGGFSYEASAEDFDAEAGAEEETESGTEGQIALYQWASDASEDEQEEYTTAEEAMAAALDRYETIVEFPTDSTTGAYTVSKSEVSSLVNEFLNSHPEYFYVSQISYVSLTNGLVKRLIFTYSDTAEKLTDMRAEYKEYLMAAAAQVDADCMNEAQVCAVIHDYLAANCEYDKTNDNKYNAYGALVEGKAVCQGYALAYQAVLNYLGIPCITVASDDMDHAWNMVEIGEYYYHVDVTWDDSSAAPGQVYHNNLLLSKAGIEATGHYGYTVESAVMNNTATTYMNEFWKNVYCQIQYYDSALYYIYPEEDEADAYDGQSVTEQFLFIRKPTGDSEGENAEILTYTYASLEGEELTALYQSLKYYARLVRDADTWYINTAYGIFSVDMAEAAMAEDDSAAKEEVYRLSEAPEDETIIYGTDYSTDYPVINGLWCDGSTLYYQTEGGELTEVSRLTLSEPEAENLYLYEEGGTLVLSLDTTYQLHPFWLPKAAAPVLRYTSSSANYVSVSDTGLLKANAYTHDAPVTITVSDSEGLLEASVQVEVAHVSVTGILLSNANTTLTPGQTKQLTACVTPGNATCREVTYSVYSMEPVSSGEEVATVDEDGLVTALSAGTAVIRASVEDSVLNADGNRESATYYVDCKVTVASDSDEVTSSGDTTDTKATEATEDTQQQADASTEGTQEQTGVSTEGSQSVSGIALNKSTLSMKMLKAKTLSASVTPSSAANKDIIWTSSNKSVAVVTEITGTMKAQVKAVGVGTAVICATTAEGAYIAKCTVTVTTRSIAKAVTAKITKKSYTGKAVKPSVTVVLDGVKLKKNRDYKITYKNNKKVGTATITIKGIGNYKGTKKITFRIAPRTPEAQVKAASSSLLVTYNKVLEADGYQIICAKNKAFTRGKRKITIKQNKIFATTITRLSSGTVYYIKIRSYKVVGNQKIYSDYNNIGRVKTK